MAAKTCVPTLFTVGVGRTVVSSVPGAMSRGEVPSRTQTSHETDTLCCPPHSLTLLPSPRYLDSKFSQGCSTFSSLVSPRPGRTVVAKALSNMLVLATKGAVELSQPEAYGDIEFVVNVLSNDAWD